MLNNEHQQSLYNISTLTQDDILNILVSKTENIQQTNTIMPVLNSINLNITPGELCSQLCQTFHLNK